MYYIPQIQTNLPSQVCYIYIYYYYHPIRSQWFPITGYTSVQTSPLVAAFFEVNKVPFPELFRGGWARLRDLIRL